MKYYEILKRISQKSDHHTHKISCLIVKKSRIIGRGWNSISTHPESNHAFKCKHAEFNAFLNSNRDISGSVVYVFRENKLGVPAMARPCAACYKLLMEQGAKRIIYTFEGSYKEEKIA